MIVRRCRNWREEIYTEHMKIAQAKYNRGEFFEAILEIIYGLPYASNAQETEKAEEFAGNCHRQAAYRAVERGEYSTPRFSHEDIGWHCEMALELLEKKLTPRERNQLAELATEHYVAAETARPVYLTTWLRPKGFFRGKAQKFLVELH